MTNEQIKNLVAGDYIAAMCNGRRTDYEVLEVRTTGECVNENSGAFGHAYACITLQYQGSELVVETSITSDDYIRGEGYLTHNVDENRTSGWFITGHNMAA